MTYAWLLQVKEYENNPQGQRSRSNVINFQTLLAFTIGHSPTKLQFPTSSFRDFLKTDRLTDRQTDAAITIPARSIAGAQIINAGQVYVTGLCNALNSFYLCLFQRKLYSTEKPVLQSKSHETYFYFLWLLLCFLLCQKMRRLRGLSIVATIASSQQFRSLALGADTSGSPSGSAP